MAKLSDLLVSLLIVGVANTLHSDSEVLEKAKEVEAKIIIRTINVVQQPFLIENQRFASTLQELELGIPAETQNYEYKVFALAQTQAQVTARAKQRGLRSYTGAVSLVKDNTLGSSIAVTVCETKQPSQIPPEIPQAPPGSEQEIKCPFDSKRLGW